MRAEIRIRFEVKQRYISEIVVRSGGAQAGRHLLQTGYELRPTRHQFRLYVGGHLLWEQDVDNREKHLEEMDRAGAVWDIDVLEVAVELVPTELQPSISRCRDERGP